MKIVVDADACPAKESIINVAQEFHVPVVMVASIAHNIERREAVTVIQTDKTPQAVDMVIMNQTAPGDIIITQDYGLAAVVLGKGAKALSPRGRILTEAEMPMLLEIKALQDRLRRGGVRTRGVRSYTWADAQRLTDNLRSLLLAAYSA